MSPKGYQLQPAVTSVIKKNHQLTLIASDTWQDVNNRNLPSAKFKRNLAHL